MGTCRQVCAIQTLGKTARNALFPFEEVIVGFVAVRAKASIGVIVVDFITVKAMGQILTVQTATDGTG